MSEDYSDYRVMKEEEEDESPVFLDKKTRGQREGLLNPSPCCMSSSTLIMEILMDD